VRVIEVGAVSQCNQEMSNTSSTDGIGEVNMGILNTTQTLLYHQVMLSGCGNGVGYLMSESQREASTDTSAMSRLLASLSSESRRLIVAYFMDGDTAIASVADLAEHVHAELDDANSDSLEQVTIQLHHVDLPKLAATSVLDYDPRTRTVRYHGEPTLEDMQEYLAVDGD